MAEDKKCSKCLEHKPFSCFSKNPTNGYYHAYCKQCSCSMSRVYNLQPSNRFKTAKTKAFKKSRVWEISYIDWNNLIDQGCFYCKVDLATSVGSSLDRIDNSRGYTLDNVLPCCTTCNKIRNTFLSVDEMTIAMQAVLAYRASNQPKLRVV